MLHTTSVPAADLIRLSDLIKHYSQALACSQAAAAWELRETFTELASFHASLGLPDCLDESICRVGTVAMPGRQRGMQRISLPKLITYFEQYMLAGGTGLEFVECGGSTDGVRLVAAAAVGFDRRELMHQLGLVERLFPDLRRQVAAADEPKGRRLDSTRRAFAGLMEMAANAARKDPGDPFCKLVAQLDPGELPTTLARKLHQLADKLAIENYPGNDALKNIL